MIINLAKGRGTLRQPLPLPATAAEFRDAISILQSTSGSGVLRIASVMCPVSNLEKYITNEDVTDPDVREKLNMLAEKVDAMSEQSIKTFVGALDMTSIDSLDDVLRVSNSLRDYIFIDGITTEKELGRFLVDSGYKGFPESVKPYLDYNAIGIEYHAKHDGAFTVNGYTLRRSSAEPLITGQEERAVVFRVHLRTGGMRNLGQDPYVLTLPASEEQMQYAKNALNIEDFAEAAVVQVDCAQEYLNQYLPLDYPDVVLLNQLAESISQAWSGEDAFKLTAALAAERPATLDAAIELADNLSRYELMQCTREEYGKQALLKLTGDQEVVDTVDGFIDWGKFGESMMQEDGIVQTEYGMIRRVSDPAPEQAMEMQSPFM